MVEDMEKSNQLTERPLEVDRMGKESTIQKKSAKAKEKEINSQLGEIVILNLSEDKCPDEPSKEAH